MYIVEIIAKFLKNRKAKRKYMAEIEPEDDFENCNHIYLAIDSTQDYFACNKCGHVIKNSKKPETQNIFKV